MKNTLIKIICLSLTISSSAYTANLGKFCSKLDITIRNNTADTCVLLYSDVMSGKLSNRNDILQIPPGQSSSMALESDGEADAQLTYACGKGMATIHMIKKSCLDYLHNPELKRLLRSFGKGGLVFEKELPLASIISMADMDVTYQLTPSMYGFLAIPVHFYDEPSYVSWTFH